MMTLVGLIVTVSLLVVVHEWGHYVVARFCGVHVEAFSVGFGKVIWHRTDKRGCDWRLSLFPLGGYVKMLSESEKESNEKEGRHYPEALYRRHAFENTAPVKRLAVVLAGPVMNFVLAVLIYAGIVMHGVWEVAPVIAEPGVGTPAAAAGMTQGMRIRAVDDRPVASYGEMRFAFFDAIGGEAAVRVGEDADERTFVLDLTGIDGKEDVLQALGLTPLAKSVAVASLVKGGAAEAAGLRVGEIITHLNGRPVSSLQNLVASIREFPGIPVTLTLKDAKTEALREVTLTPASVTDGGKVQGRIGAGLGATPELTFVQKGPVDALVHGVRETDRFIRSTLSSIGKMLTGKISTDTIGGPIMIGDIAGQAMQVGLVPFLNFLALISLTLGVFNLIPVPVLDGGQAVCAIYEMVLHRPVSRKVLDIAQKIGLGLIGLLMIFALGNDIARLFALN